MTRCSPIDNSHVENRIRPVALGRSNWLFAGSLRAGQRAAAAMSLIQSAKLNGLEPSGYLKDVFTRMPTGSVSSCPIVGARRRSAQPDRAEGTCQSRLIHY